MPHEFSHLPVGHRHREFDTVTTFCFGIRIFRFYYKYHLLANEPQHIISEEYRMREISQLEQDPDFWQVEGEDMFYVAYDRDEGSGMRVTYYCRPTDEHEYEVFVGIAFPELEEQVDIY